MGAMLARVEAKKLAQAVANTAGTGASDNPVWAVLRRQGEARRGGWTDGGRLERVIGRLLAGREAAFADTLELAVLHPGERIDAGRGRELANRNRGRWAYQFSFREQERLVSPLQSIASNRRLDKERDEFLAEAGIDMKTFQRAGTAVAAPASQVLVEADAGGHARLQALYRGNRIVPLAAVTAGEAQQMFQRLLAWVRANQRANGALPYKYWPGRDRYAGSDNAIRQILVTLALSRAAQAGAGPEADVLVPARLARNLADHFVDCGDYGALSCGGKGKLGATALAALALLEHEGPAGPHADVLAKLRAGIDRQWQEDGAFRTYFWPETENGCQNFYPGQALLFYATWYQLMGGEALRDRCWRSFACYRDWHRRQPNPAFVPWHTQALARLYAATGDAALRDFVFEMNDWLVGLQQWGEPLEGDLWGRFYAPGKPQYGPPHAASTGVYLESLAVAYRLAKAEADTDRAATYRQAYRRGLRSLRQLQMVDQVDHFYVARRQATFGALRTEAYDNEIRLDNAGHAMLALLNLPNWAVADPPAGDAPDSLAATG